MNDENMKLRFFAIDPKTHVGVPGCLVRFFFAVRISPPSSQPSGKKKADTTDETATPIHIALAATRTDLCG